MATKLIALYIFITLPFIIALFFDFLDSIYDWQNRDYSIKRMFMKVRYEWDRGKKTEVNFMFKILLLTFIIVYTIVSTEKYLIATFLIAYFYYLYISTSYIFKVFNKQYFFPRFTKWQNVLIIIFLILLLFTPVSIFSIWLNGVGNIAGLFTDNVYVQQLQNLNTLEFLESLKIFLPRTESGILLVRVEYIIILFSIGLGIFLDLISDLLVFLAVLLIKPIYYINRRYIKSRAKTRISRFRKLITIGVLGNYGKDITIDLLYQLLIKFKNVVKSQENNDDYGIALDILNKVKSTTDIFITPIEIYDVKDVQKITKDVVEFDYSVITNLDQKSISILGGINNMLASAYDLVNGTKKDGVVILNASNEYCLTLSEKLDKKSILYYLFTNFSQEETLLKSNTNIFIKNIEEHDEGINFDLIQNKEVFKVKTNLKLKSNIQNLFVAILIAIDLNIPIDKIVNVINRTKFITPYLNIYTGINNSKIIDNTFNANPSNFIKAIKYLNKLGGDNRKIIFTQGLMELGKKRENINDVIASEIVNSANILYTTDIVLYERVKKLNSNFNVLYLHNSFEFVPYYEKLTKKGDIILLEGEFPREAVNQLITIK